MIKFINSTRFRLFFPRFSTRKPGPGPKKTFPRQKATRKVQSPKMHLPIENPSGDSAEYVTLRFSDILSGKPLENKQKNSKRKQFDNDDIIDKPNLKTHSVKVPLKNVENEIKLSYRGHTNDPLEQKAKENNKNSNTKEKLQKNNDFKYLQTEKISKESLDISIPPLFTQPASLNHKLSTPYRPKTPSLTTDYGFKTLSELFFYAKNEPEIWTKPDFFEYFCHFLVSNPSAEQHPESETLLKSLIAQFPSKVESKSTYLYIIFIK